MKSTVLLVVASIHLGGSYYNQTALSSVLSKFEAQLTVPRRKDAEQTAPVTSTAPAATPLLRADATLTPADATPTPMTVASVDESSTEFQVIAGNSTVGESTDSTLLSTTVASVDESSTEFQVIAGNSTVGEPTDSTLLSTTVASGDKSLTESQVIMDNFTVDEQADSTLLSVNVNPVDKSLTATQVIADNLTVDEPAESTLLSVNVTPVDKSSTAVILVDKETSTMSTTTALRAVHVVANSGTSHVWTFKEVSLVSHLSQILWLCALTGMSTYFIGAQALLWRAVENLRRARAQAVHV